MNMHEGDRKDAEYAVMITASYAERSNTVIVL